MINKYAKIENNIVTNIFVCNDSQISFQNGFNIKVTQDTRDAHIGSSYDSVNNKFIDEKPFESWIFNETTFEWDSPTGPKPDSSYFWLESTQEWKKLGE